MAKRAGVMLVCLFAAAGIFTACRNGTTDGSRRKTQMYKGLYSFGPEVHSFTECEEGREYWVLDSVHKLELAYNDMQTEKPYEPVYVEVEGYLQKSDTTSAAGDYDSTLVVLKMDKITRQAPDGPCAN